MSIFLRVHNISRVNFYSQSLGREKTWTNHVHDDNEAPESNLLANHSHQGHCKSADPLCQQQSTQTPSFLLCKKQEGLKSKVRIRADSALICNRLSCVNLPLDTETVSNENQPSHR